jgi:hypothetical protein
MRNRIQWEKQMAKLIAVATALLVAACLLATIAKAGEVYTNGQTTFGYGFNLSVGDLADDFTFDVGHVLTGATLSTFERDHDFDGRISYWIYPMTGGKPGPTSIAHGIGKSIIRTDLGEYDHWYGFGNRRHYEFAFESPVYVGSGETYFLALHFQNQYYTDSPNAEIYWATADAPRKGVSAYTHEFPSGAWHNLEETAVYGFLYNSLAFGLQGRPVPEPSTLLLLSLAAIGGLAVRRR